MVELGLRYSPCPYLLDRMKLKILVISRTLIPFAIFLHVTYCKYVHGFAPSLPASSSLPAARRTNVPLQDALLSTSSSTTTLLCQLLGMNCATPTDFNFSFRGFCRRGGATDIHSDGWGIAFYENGGIRQFHDVEAASTSPLANYLGQQSIQTLNMIGHIRFATQGTVNLSNVHPFSREMWGIIWCFCHNGEVPVFSNGQRANLKSLCGAEPAQYYSPVGTTDSEAVFCAILNALRCKFTTVPSLPVLHHAIQQLCGEIVSQDPEGTILNFLLTCGPYTQWVYSWPGSRPGSTVWNGLFYATREFPFAKVRLSDMDVTVDFGEVTTADDCVSVIATRPLTNDEEWTEVSRGELIVFDQGKPFQTPYDLFRLELRGHGLQSSVLKKSSLENDMKQYNLDLGQFQGQFI